MARESSLTWWVAWGGWEGRKEGPVEREGEEGRKKKKEEGKEKRER